ncbi:hypothetical protein AB0B95_04060, partial [Streptomyces hygroscopicus]
TNTTMVLLDVKEPVTQSMIIGIQGIVAVLLLDAARPASRPAATALPIADENPAPRADHTARV